MELLEWDVYELSSAKEPLIGVSCRRKIREFSIKENINLLVDNATDVEGRVRFAVLSGSSIKKIEAFLKTVFPDIKVKKKLEKVKPQLKPS